MVDVLEPVSWIQERLGKGGYIFNPVIMDEVSEVLPIILYSLTYIC